MLDVTDHAALKAAAARHKGVNVLYNGAGWVHQGMLGTTERSKTGSAALTSTCTPMFVLTQAFLPAFIAQGGASIVNIASMASSLKGVPNRISYMSTKAAVIGFTKSVAFDYMKDGIRANAICPGSVDSAVPARTRPGAGRPRRIWKTFHRPPAHAAAWRSPPKWPTWQSIWRATRVPTRLGPISSWMAARRCNRRWPRGCG